MSMHSNSNHLGSSSNRAATSSRKGIPFDPPAEGSRNDDEDEMRPTRQRRIHMNHSPYSGIGNNTLHEPKSTSKIKQRSIPPNRFYEGESPRSNRRLPHNHAASSSEFPFASVLSGTPAPRRLKMRRQSPLDRTDPPAQHRNASRVLGKSTKGESKEISKETIEISSSEEDEDDDVVAEAGPSPSRSISKKNLARVESKSRSGSVSSSNKGGRKSEFGNASKPGSIRRKSESPQEEKQVDWNARNTGIVIKEGDTIRDKLPPLDNDRAIKISGSTGQGKGSDIPRPSMVGKMKDRNGNTSKQHLGGRMKSGLSESGYKQDTANVTHIQSKASLDTSPPTLRLANVGICSLAQVKSGSAEPSLSWNIACDLQLDWMQGEKKISLLIFATDIMEFEVIDENATQGLCIQLKDPKTVVDKLSKKLGDAGKKALMRPEVAPGRHIVLLPLKGSYGSVVDDSAWLHLLASINKALVTPIKLNLNTFLSFKSEFESLRDLVEASTADHRSKSTNDPSQLRLRPSATSTSMENEPDYLGSALQLRQTMPAIDTEENEEQNNKASVEAITKAQIPTEPQKAKLSYPFESPGAVNVFQSDLDKLDDDEMLNDTIVELGLRYLLEDIRKRDPPLYDEIYVFSSFFYKRINENKRDRKTAYEFVKKWTKKVDLFKKKYLVIPINEKMHWYLAIITNPFYAVKEVERKNGKYESDGEKEDEREVDYTKKSSVDGDTAEETVEESSEIAQSVDGTESTKQASVSDLKVRASEEVETMGDTPMKDEKMKDEKTLSVEVVVPSSSVKSDKKSSREDLTDYMEMDDDKELEGPLKMVSNTELEDKYNRSKRNTSLKTSVIDKRSLKSPRSSVQITLSDDDDNPVHVRSNSSPRKSRLSQKGRPGFSDGISNLGKGTMLGGGGIGFGPGEIPSFQKEDKEFFAVRKRKAEEEEEGQDVRMASPLQPQITATYGVGKVRAASVKKLMEPIQERHQEWLNKKAVVCVFDSLGSSHKAVRTALKEYLCLEYNDKRAGEIEVDEVELEHIDVVSPMQGNFCDCGLYLLHAFERFFNDPTKVMNEIIIVRDRNDPYWQAEDATKKRQWWKNCIGRLIEEYQANQAQLKAEKETRSAKKSSAKRGSEEKSKTSSPSGESRSRSLTDETSSLDMASIEIESSLEEPRV